MPRPSIPLISRRNAAEAALAVIDEVGLDKLSLTQVAERLGVKSPSLYHHFRDKNALLEEVARVLLLKVPDLKRDDQSPEEWIIALCLAARRTMLRHPNAAPLMLQFFPRRLLLRAYDRAAEIYPYPPEIHMAVIEGTEKLTFGSSLFAASAVARGTPPMPDVDGQTLPRLGQALASNPFDEEMLFAETLRIFLLGVRERVRRGDAGQPLGDPAATQVKSTPSRRRA